MHKKQSGATLIISLIILVSLTLFVLSGSQTVLLQEKMTAAVRDNHISLEIAESGITDAKAIIEALSDVSSFNSSGSNGLYSEGDGPTDLFADATWTDANTAEATTEVSGENAKYFIEDLGEESSSDDSSSVSISGYGETSDTSDIEIFKIVSRSIGRDENTERIIVSYYAKSL